MMISHGMMPLDIRGLDGTFSLFRLPFRDAAGGGGHFVSG